MGIFNQARIIIKKGRGAENLNYFDKEIRKVIALYHIIDTVMEGGDVLRRCVL